MNSQRTEHEHSAAWVEGELRLIGGLNERLFRLLAAIENTGSINRAAREVGLSYKGAWEMVERANNLSPRILVSTTIGGRHGGGTQLTPAGKDLLKLFNGLREEHRLFLERLNRQLADNPDLILLFRRFTMKASARNQLFGTVTAVHPGGVNTEVVVGLKGGDSLVASVTRESEAALGIAPGVEVVALIKAPLVMVVKDFGGYRLSARNQLAGTVSRLQKGAVNAEVVIQLAGGDSIAATITNDSVDSLGLKDGDAATAVFKAGAVILGVAGK
jgi:molybdate transport system regulatory protein